MKNYYLTGCVLLWATVLGTRGAYHAAKEMLPLAKAHDADTFYPSNKQPKNQQPKNNE